MNVSVIIPAYNNAKTIASVLEALDNQEFSKGETEVMVIDDGSKDSTVEICKSRGVRVVPNDQNRGLGYSLNKGIKLSKHKLIVTLHGDTVPLSNTWLKELLTPFTDPTVMGTCSLQEPPDINNHPCLWEKLLWGKLEAHNAFNDKADAYRKDVLSGLDFFDYKTFRTAGEDEDLALRLRQANNKTVPTNARVLHNDQESYRTSFRCLLKILRKEYVFGRAGGALRRKFPFHKPGSYVYPSPKSFVSDGGIRTCVCIGCLLPYIQILCIPLLILGSLVGFLKTLKRLEEKKTVLLYPFLNILRFCSYSIGYPIGLIRGKQE